MKRLVAGAGYDVYETGDNVALSIDPAALIPPADFPFNVKLSGTTFKVTAGTVNGVMATLGGTRLDALPAPTSTVSSTSAIYLKCQHNAGSDFPVTVTVEKGSSVPANEEEFLYIPIATVNVTSGKAVKTAQVVRTSLAAEYFKCGSSDPEYYVSQA